jgi:hypothetical protein
MEGRSMTGAVLALAGLTCGDGGLGVEAMTGVVTVNEELLLRLDGSWEGTWEGYGESDEYICWCVTVRHGKIRIAGERRADALSFALVPEGRGKVRVVLGGMASPGIYRLDRGRLLICASVEGEEGPRPTSFHFTPWSSQLFTLKPAPPHTP